MYWVRRNTRFAYAINGLQNATTSLPIWLLFYTRQLHLSVTAAIVLLIARWGTVALCNIPTGAWADRFGRIKMYRLGQFFYALSFLPFLFTNNFVLLFVVQIIGGLMASMSIGVVEPLIKDTYELAGLPPRKFTHFLSNNTVVLYIFRLAAGIFGAWLYVKHPYGPYACDAGILMLAYVASLFMKEFRQESATAHSNRQHIGEALRYVWNHTYLRNFFFALILVAIATESTWTGLQPIFVYKDLPTATFGILFGIVALLSALGAYVSRHIADKVDGIKIYWCITMAATVGTALFLVPAQWVSIIALIPLGLAFGFIEPIGNTNFQRHTTSKYQSTVLSLRSLLYTGFYALVSVLVGRYVDLFTTKTMILIITIQGAVCSLVLGGIWLATALPVRPKPQVETV